MLLYHGTDYKSAINIKRNGILFDKCDEWTDNGQGFYLSIEKKFAQRRAEVITNHPLKPALVTMNFDFDKAKKELEILTFYEASDDWKFFVTYNRMGKEHLNTMLSLFPNKKHNLYKDYDVVIDMPADCKIADKTILIEAKIKEFEKLNDKKANLKIYQEQISKLIESISIGTGSASSLQYSFHTDISLDYLSIVE